jgi:hypothetical protein
MKLRTLFAIPIAVILVVTLSLAGMIAGEVWSERAHGRAAVDAVEGMRQLLLLQGDLAAERAATNIVLAAPFPLPQPQARRFAAVRADTDQRLDRFVERHRSAAGNITAPEPWLVEVLIKLGVARAATDALLRVDRSHRELRVHSALLPRMLAVARTLHRPLTSAAHEVNAAAPGLSGLLTAIGITTALREELGQVAALLMPRFNNGEQASATELSDIRRMLTLASEQTRLLAETIEIVDSTERTRDAIDELKREDASGVLLALGETMDTARLSPNEDDGILPPQRFLLPWGERIDALRLAILDAMVRRASNEEASGEHQLNIAITAFGLVLVAVLESIVLLSQRVVNPLAQLGTAITRIAAGDRRVALQLPSGTHEIAEMVTAVETLRQAALVADAAAIRQRVAARRRSDLLHEALGIVQAVQEPAHALERSVAQLSAGIDATIALFGTATTARPSTLGAAAAAVRVGLAEMQDSAADLDATFAAASSAQSEGRSEAEFRAHILAVQAQVDRRSVTIRGFVQPSLVALRDAASASGNTPGPRLHDLVSDQFSRIEDTVAMVASMSDAVTRAAAMVRELPLDDTPMAA